MVVSYKMLTEYFAMMMNKCKNNIVYQTFDEYVIKELNYNNHLRNFYNSNLKSFGGIVELDKFEEAYKDAVGGLDEKMKMLSFIPDKYRDTEVFKYLKKNITKLYRLYLSDKKGTQEILKSLNALAKYEKECIVGGELPKKEKSQIRNLIDNI